MSYLFLVYLMMFITFGAFILFASFPVTDSDYKKEIETHEKKIAYAAKNELSKIKFSLAKLHYLDQNQKKSFKIFLESLDDNKEILESKVTENEKLLFNEAFEFYLNSSISSANKTSFEILEKYESILEQNVDYHLLRYIVASAYANCGRFIEFFDNFYQSYQRYPDHFMADKAKAVLYIKLFERAIYSLEKESFREKILENISKAIEKCPNDHTLYKPMIAFSAGESKERNVKTYLNKIVDENIITPRSDIAFYVKVCIDTNQFELGKKFISKAKIWYEYSQSIERYEKLLN